MAETFDVNPGDQGCGDDGLQNNPESNENDYEVNAPKSYWEHL